MSGSSYFFMQYEPVIGLEVHVQLKTASKMFTSVPYRFGAEPNTLIDPVVLALPGTLPVLNREAIRRTILVGMLLESKIPQVCKWDRKNYFYPDSPKNYQLSQYDQPLCEGGKLEIALDGASRNEPGPRRRVSITRVHLEEDVGKLTHGAEDSMVDYNRAGAALIEIVTEPDLYSADEAFAFLTALRRLMIYAGISDCDMEKGQLRCDANISIRPVGQTSLGTKVELKNLNSISGVRDGIAYEIRRQVRALETGAAIRQETRRWDADQKLTSPMRGKEEEHDYRYFPDPDLMPIHISDDWKARIAEDMPERPLEKLDRFIESLGLSFYAATELVADRGLADFFEEILMHYRGEVANAANLVINDVLRAVGAGEGNRFERATFPISAENLAGLLAMVDSGKLSKAMAREVFDGMLESGQTAEAEAGARGLQQSSDAGEIENLCREAIAANPKAVSQYREGNEKAINAVKGFVMKATQGKANPQVVSEVLEKLLKD